jgi:hypothetical protein
MKVTVASDIERIECEGAPNWKGVASRVPNSSNEFTLTVQSIGALQPRTVSDTLRLVPFDRQGRKIPARAISITGEVVPDILPSPRAIYFGPVEIDSEKVEELRLRSLIGRSFRVIAVGHSPANAGITITAQGTSPSEAWYAVRLQADREGEQHSEVTFQIEESDGTRYALLVPIRYVGRPAGVVQ